METSENLRLEAIKEIDELREQKRHPKVTADIDAVLVFSGPGTYYKALENDEPSWARWMDRDRIRMGVAIVKEATAAKMREQKVDPDKKGHYVTKEEILKYGPYFIYNGIPSENRDFRKAMSTPQAALPWEKVILIDGVKEDGEITPIRHTLDQVKSLPKSLFEPGGIVQRKLALVSNAEHFPRIWRYLKKWEDLPKNIKLISFKIPTRAGHDQYTKDEAERVVEYQQKGHLSDKPIPHDS